MEVVPNVEEHCSKIKLEDGRDLYFSIKEGKTAATKQCWNVILTDGKVVWDTAVTEDILSDMAEGSSYKAQQFVDLFKTAFNLLPPDSGTILKYKLTAMSTGKDRFFWSIYLPQNNQTFKLGEIDVSPLAESERAPVYCRMFDSLLSVTNQSRKNEERSRVRSEEERKCANLACQKLEKYVTVQDQCEKVLYTNFVAVLNEKKRKIRELQDQCDSLKQSLDGSSTAETVTQEVSSVPAKRGRAKAAPRRGKPPVSACVAAPRKQQTKQVKGVEYDSDATTDMEERTGAASKRSRRLVESSDDEATDVDDAGDKTKLTSSGNTAELSHTAHDKMDTNSAEPSHTSHDKMDTNTGAEDRARDSPTLDVDVKLTMGGSDTSSPTVDDSALTADLAAASAPAPKGPMSKSSPSKAVTEALLDDLLDDCKPSTSSKQKSPVKRRAAPRKAARAVQKAAPKEGRPVRGKKTTPSPINDSLIDDLLDGM